MLNASTLQPSFNTTMATIRVTASQISRSTSSERPEITSHDEEPKKAKTTKAKIESTKGQKMNLKKQIAVIVLALTATTSLVWSQDRPLRQSPPTNSSGDVARYQNRGRLYNRSGYIVISGYHDLQPATALPPAMGSHLVAGPGRGPNTGVWQREPGSQNYSIPELCLTAMTGRRFCRSEVKLPQAIHLTTANSFTIAARSRSSTLMGI